MSEGLCQLSFMNRKESTVATREYDESDGSLHSDPSYIPLDILL